MRGLLSVLALGLLLQSTACAPECKPGEARSGDSCVKLPDSVQLGESDSSVPIEAGDDASGADVDDLAGDCDADCVVDACHPNPCVHGTCTLDGDAYSCVCDPDWQVDGLCSLNSNSSLQGLAVSGGRLWPSFDPEVTSYEVVVGVEAPAISVTATAVQPSGVVLRIEGEVVPSGQPSKAHAVALNESSPSIRVSVSASGGSERVYTLSPTRTLMLQSQVSSYDLTGTFGDGGNYSVFGSGRGVGFRGSFLAAGSPGADLVRIYARSGSAWSERFSLHPAVRDEGKGFGSSIAVDEDWLVVAALDSKRVYAYRRDELLSPQRREHIIAPEQQPGALSGYGASVALAGSTLVVGAIGETIVSDSGTYERAGAAYVFEYDGTEWRPAGRLQSPTPSSEANCGTHVAVEDGLLAVACPEERPRGAATDLPPVGAVYLYERRQGQWHFTEKLQVANSAGFGGGLGISSGRVAVSSPYLCIFSCVGTPAVHVFEQREGVWQSTATVGVPHGLDVAVGLDPFGFGAAGLAFQGHLIVVGAILEGSPLYGVTPIKSAVSSEGELWRGAAYLFEESALGWRLAARLGPAKADSASAQATHFGASCALDEGTIVVSAPEWAGIRSGTENTGSGSFSVFGADCSSSRPGLEAPGC